MKVLVKDELHDAEHEPIVLVLTPEDKVNIARLPPHIERMLVFPAGTLTEEQSRELLERAVPSMSAAPVGTSLEPRPVLVCTCKWVGPGTYEIDGDCPVHGERRAR